MKSRGSILTFVSLLFGFSQSHATEFPICKENYVISENKTISQQRSLEKILDKNPKDVACMLKLASVYFRVDKVASGFDLVRRAYALNPNFVAQKNVSKVLDLALRVSRLKELATRNKDKELWNELGNTYYDMGIFNEAKRAFEESLALDGGQKKSEILLALSHGNLGDMEKSLLILKGMVQRYPYDFYVNYYYGKILKNEFNDGQKGLVYLMMADYILHNQKTDFENDDEKTFLLLDLRRELEEK